MPYALKGIDMAIFSTFRSLGLLVKACPVLVSGDEELDSESELDSKGEPAEPTRAGTGFHGIVDSNYDESCDDNLEEVGTYHSRFRQPYSTY